MRGITIWQPWAHLVATGVKPIENRQLTLRGPALRLVGEQLAIHAGRSTVDPAELTRFGDLIGDLPVPLWAGAIVGVATLRGVHVHPWAELPPAARPWATGPLLLELADARLLATPIPCRGFLGLWPVIDPIADQVRAQLGGAP